jgi:hypothetical protein
MFRRYSILLGTFISLVLLFLATLYYPGGSQRDQYSAGYGWKNNYLSNLFSPIAINGSPNASRPWAVAGMLFLCASVGLFFFEFSKKIVHKSASKVIRYCGLGAALFAFLAVTPYHDQMVIIASTLSLVSMFYITVFVFKPKLHLFTILSVACLLIYYTCNYLYFAHVHIELLPIAQKLALAITILWVLCLHYFTTPSDFASAK